MRFGAVVDFLDFHLGAYHWPAFNAAGMRLTASVARWSPMLSNYSLLAPRVDRLMQMETYVADSMRGWVDGDSFGGNYGPFVEGATVQKAAPGFLCSALYVIDLPRRELSIRSAH